MYYMFVKMSSGWFGKEVLGIKHASYDAEAHVDNGEVVVFTDDIEAFTDEMGIESDDITW